MKEGNWENVEWKTEIKKIYNDEEKLRKCRMKEKNFKNVE